VRDVLERLPGWSLSDGALRLRLDAASPILIREARRLPGVRVRRLRDGLEIRVPLGPRAGEIAFAVEALRTVHAS